MTADIHFSCDRCGQKIIVGAEAAGLTADCPSCGQHLMIPAPDAVAIAEARIPSALLEPHHPTDREEAPIFTHDGSGNEVARLREEAQSLRAENRRTEMELARSREEAAGLREVRAALQEEIARLKDRVRASREEIKSLQIAVEQSRLETETLMGDMEVTRQKLAATESQLEAREGELARSRSQIAEIDTARARAQAEIALLQEESAILQREIETLRATEAQKELLDKELAKIIHELDETRTRLKAEEEGCASLRICVEELRREKETLRRDLQETGTGKQIVELRDQVTSLTEERDRLRAELHVAQEDYQKMFRLRTQLEDTIKSLGKKYEEARLAAERVSDERLLHDNEVLRGIIARQNSELEQRHVEIRKHRRRKYVAQIAYAVFAIVLGLVVVTVVKALENVKIFD